MPYDTLRSEEWVTFEGKELQVDLRPGDCQLDYDIRGDREFSVYISFGEKVIPIGRGLRVHGRLFVADIRWMLIKTDKVGMFGTSIFQRDRTICDVISNKPLAVFVPEAPVVDLRTMVNRIVGQRLEEQMGPGETEVSLEEFFDDDIPDGEEDFGPGFMEVDEHTAEVFQARVADRKHRAEQAKQKARQEQEDKRDVERGGRERDESVEDEVVVPPRGRSRRRVANVSTD